MRNIKNYLKTGFLLLGILILTTNCEKDSDIDTEKNVSEESLQNKIIIKEFTFNQLKSTSLFQKTFQFFNDGKSKNKNNISNKSVIELMYNFTIDSTKIKEVQVGSYTSYTFSIKRSFHTPNYFENLVIQKDSLNNINAFIIKYTPNNKIKINKIHNSYSFEGERSVTKIIYNESTVAARLTNICYNIIEIWCSWDGNHVASGSCFVGSHLYEKPVTTCDGWGDDFSSTGPTISNNTTTGNDNPEGSVNGTSTTTTNNTVISAPLISFEQLIFQNFVKYDLNIAEKSWINDIENSDYQNQISNFLNNNLNDSELDYTLESKKYAIEAIDLLIELDDFNKLISSEGFDPLENPWLNGLREYAKRLQFLKDKISNEIWQNLNKYLDKSLSLVLTEIAFIFNPEANTLVENIKNNAFTYDGENGVGVLLYEFANGAGPNERSFNYGEHDIAKQFFSESIVNAIKNDFLNEINNKGLTYDQFTAQGNSIDGSYSFSPDHTSAVDSFNKHKNANWVQFFIGGASIKYTPSINGWVDVKLTNPTSRNSLLLHIGDSYPRDIYGKIPLSTIQQHYHIKLKIQ